MSLISFIFKNKKSMAEPYTKRVKLNKYTLTSHAQNRIVDKTRKLTKFDVIDDYYKPKLYKSPIMKDDDGSKKYYRVGRRITSVISYPTNNVRTLWNNNPRRLKKYGIVHRKRKVFKHEKKIQNK